MNSSMSSVAPNWKECKVQMFTGTQPRITPMTVAVAIKYTSQASSRVDPTGSPSRARRTAPGMPMSAGTSPMMLTMPATARVLSRSSAYRVASTTHSSAPPRMLRSRQLRGWSPARAWLMKRKEPQVAVSAARLAACRSTHGISRHRYCVPRPNRCSENSRLPVMSSAYWMNSTSRRLSHCARL